LTLIFITPLLRGQEGVLSLVMDSDEAFSGRIRLVHDGWELLGAVAGAVDEGVPELGNFLLKTPWGGVGSLTPRGILKELETPSLSRAPQSPGQPGPGFDTSFEGSPRRGFLLGSPEGSAGLAGWTWQERQNLGFWYGNRGLPGNSWGAGLLLREGEIRYSTEWLEEKPLALSSWLVSAGWWGHLRIPWLRGGAGLFWSAAPADPPGVWGRFWGEIGEGDLKVFLSGGASSPRVWNGGGGRLEELAFYSLGASWKPWKPLFLEARFTETQGHRGDLYYSYHPHRIEGSGSLILKGTSGELKGAVLRVINHDEKGGTELSDLYQVQGLWTPGNFRILGKVARRPGPEEKVDFSGALGYGREGWGLTLEGALGREGEAWRREGEIDVVWVNEKVQLRIAAGLHREDGGLWQGTGKISLRWKFYGK
jgi:hypothetical protein